MTGPDRDRLPALSVVVVGATPAGLGRTLASVRVSAAAAGARVELITAWVGDGPPPATAADTVLVELFPVGSAYARNRGLALSSAPVVAFLDEALEVAPTWANATLSTFADGGIAAAFGVPRADPSDLSPIFLQHPHIPPRWLAAAGSNAAFSRPALTAAGGFDHALLAPPGRGRETVEAALRLARAGASVARVGGMVAGGTPASSVREVVAVTLASLRRPRRRSPRAPLRFLPAELERRIVGRLRPLPASHRAKTHYLYAAPPHVLHLYVNPSERLRRSLAERERIRAGVRAGGVPAVVAVAHGRDCVWLLEERLRGEPPRPGAPETWFEQVAEWAVAMAGEGGPPLGSAARWQEHAREAAAAVPEALRSAARGALDAVARLPAVHMHGDLQPKNVLLAGRAVGAVDWEGAWLHGIPGLDLLYLALLARGGQPDARVLDALAEGLDPAGVPVRRHLERLGVGREQLGPVVLASLATWALAERQRRSRLGSPPSRETFGPLCARYGPRFAS